MKTPKLSSASSATAQPAAKRRILFVDDDPAILRTLSEMLEAHTEAWDMRFVDSPAEALVLVESWQPHVVVSDLQMPLMDGASLLKQVRKQHPSAMRIMLSGTFGLAADKADEDMRYLTKPLKQTKLVELIEHATRVDALVQDAVLRQDIAQLSCLPMLRPAERALIGEMDRPGASLKQVANLVEFDPGLAAMALRMVCSASLALPNRVERPGQAALMLGFDTLRGLVLAAGSFRSFAPHLQPLAEELSLVGAGVAAAARQEAVKLGASPREQDEAFTAGLLHGLGVLVLATLRPALVGEWQAQHPYGWPGDQAERAHFGADYAGAGAYLLSLWCLPASIVNAVAWHRAPQQGAAGAVLQALNNVTARQKASTHNLAAELVCG
jgi:HD-like signal output (HDOD) protein